MLSPELPGEMSDLTVRGSTLSAGKSILLDAEDAINLLAAKNTGRLQDDDKSNSFGVGVSYGTSLWRGHIDIAGGGGDAHGDDIFWTNTHVTAGDRLLLLSGGDTTLKGAVASGRRVVADVGGDLRIESLQDASDYSSKQRNYSANIAIGRSSSSATLGYGKSSIRSDYVSVGEQSGIKAGDDGFAVHVAGNTELKGAVIAATDKAVQDGFNRFTTGSLTLSDIANKAAYEGDAVALSITVSRGKDNKGETRTKVTGGGMGIAEESGQAASTTTSGISGIAGNTAVRTGDAETGIKPIFDADKVQKELDAQVLIAQKFSQQASALIGNYAKKQMDKAIELREEAARLADDDPRKADLRQQANEIEDRWGDKGTLRLASHTLVGGLTGGVGGAAGAAVGTLTAPAVAGELAKAGISGLLSDLITGLASTAAGAATGGRAGGSSAYNEVTNNYLSYHEAVALEKAKEKRQQCRDQACADAADAEIAFWQDLDRTRNATLAAACGNPASPGCGDEIIKVKEAAASYAGMSDGWDLFGVVSRERAEANTKAELYRIKTSSTGEAARALADLALDLTPGIGDAKGFAEAETKFDYALAIIGALGPAGDAAKALIKEAKVLFEAGDVVKAADKVEEAAALAGGSAKSPVDVAHTIGADYNPNRGRVTGGHSLLNNDVRVIDEVSPPDAFGVYEAKVEMRTPGGEWVPKSSNNGINTMLPKDWDTVRIQTEIDSAWSVRIPHPDGTPNKWLGKSSSGVQFEGFEQPRTTAYPVYGGNK